MVSCSVNFLLNKTNRFGSMLQCVCLVTDRWLRQNVVRTSVTHSPQGSCATFFSFHVLRYTTEQVHGNMESINFVKRMHTGILDSKRKIIPTSKLNNKFPKTTLSCTDAQLKL